MIPDLPVDHTYLSGVSVEQTISKSEVIAGLDAALPDLNIPSSPIALLSKDVDVAVITCKIMGDGMK